MTKGKIFDKISFVLVRLPKLKKRLVLLLSFVFIFAAVLFACDPIKLGEVPPYNATVYGNGGSAVVKGDYIYFANAYIDMTTLTNNDNKYDQNSAQTLYAIYRAKLDNSGKVLRDEDGKPKQVEIVTFNVGGYAYSGLYICGEYLYYTTPYTQRDSSGSLTTGLIRFARVKLDGTGKDLNIHSVTNYDSNSDYDIVYIDGSTYICILDADKHLSVIECRGGNTLKHLNIASDVTGIKLFAQDDIAYNQSTNDAYKYVYYTIKDSTTSIYKLCRRDLKTDGEVEILDSSTEEITVNCVKNNRVYYVKAGKLTSQGFGSADVVKTYSTISVGTGSSATQNTITNYVVLDDDNQGVVGVYYDGETYSLKSFRHNELPVDLNIQSTSAITILATIDSDIYYQISGDNALYRTSMSFPSFVPTASEATVVAPNFVLSGDSSKSQFDFDHYRLFVYEANNSSTDKYLTMYMSIGNPYSDESGTTVGQYIGKVAE